MSQRAFWLFPALVSLACSGAGGDDFFKTDAIDSDTSGSTTTGGLTDVGTPSSTSSTTAGGTGTDAGGTSSSSTTTQGGGATQGTGGTPDDSTSTSDSGGSAASGGEPSTGGSGGSPGSGGNPGSGGSPGSGGAPASGGGGNAGSSGSGGSGGSNCTATDEICDGLDNDCDDDVDEGDACPDACTGVSFEGHGYMFCVEPGNSNATRNWDWALNFCLDQGQNLVRIDTAAENDFLYEQLNEMSGSGDAWMAATDQEDEDLWVWANGDDPDTWQSFYDADEEQPIDAAFVDWSPGEPNNTPGTSGADCGAFEDLGDDEWGWADRPCSSNYDRVVCESI